ncbi:FAD-dependent oxidoreductase [Nocardiopsis lambiniae]|uniref:FAD-dependent oxidoreductase n=1 Tax=Nocardiopsis lambiniae TaxID=3075539 RepID=A0ABU2MA90_9ACTN|nr:FAD-dependent oxidoreductase [Nocardiopsis sp. DSM 44743]MDT0329527.1 FAD-dependent oxidoreductase [Nocardiopsis sp. DSM 44743]
MPEHTRIAVIGGGMAGCAAARELTAAGKEVVLFESADGLGGRARSWRRPEIEPEVGINLMCASMYSTMWGMIREYGLEGELEKISSNLLVSDGTVVAPLPSDSIPALLRYRHVRLRDRLAFLYSSMREMMVNGRTGRIDLFDPERLADFDDGTTATEYGRSLMSHRGFDYMLRSQIEGFWNFDCDGVSVSHARAMLATMGGAEFFVFREGMQVLAERNAADARVLLRHEVSEVRLEHGRVVVSAQGEGGEAGGEFDAVVVAVPAPIAAKVVASLPREAVGDRMRDYLEGQEYEPALSMSYLVDADALPPETHIMAGGAEDPPIRNMITYPRRVRGADGTVRDRLLVFAYPGRAVTRRLLGRGPEEQYATVTPLLSRLWPGFPRDPEPFQVAERPYGFPIPSPGRYRASVAATRDQRPPVVFAGDHFSSPTTEAAMRSGIRAARGILGTS